jgi:hypothetical protein
LVRNRKLAHSNRPDHDDGRKDQLQQRYRNTITMRPIDRLSKTHDSWVRLLDT